MEEKVYIAEIKWSISRARDTDGQNICTLRIDGVKVARAVGGGYDMVDACFSDWINNRHQVRMAMHCETKKTEDYGQGGGRKIADGFKDGHFFKSGVSGRWYLDGGNGCAIDSAAKIGIEIREHLKKTARRGLRGTGIYTVTVKGVE